MLKLAVCLFSVEILWYPMLFIASKCVVKLRKYSVLSFELYASSTVNACAVSFTVLASCVMTPSFESAINIAASLITLGLLGLLAFSEPGRLSLSHVEKLPPNHLHYDTCDKCDLSGKLYHSGFSGCCIAEFDHTCGFVANDVGKQNRFLFLLYLTAYVCLGFVNAVSGFRCITGNPNTAYEFVPMGIPLLYFLIGLSQIAASSVLLLHQANMLRLGHTPSSQLKCASVRRLVRRSELGIYQGSNGFDMFAAPEGGQLEQYIVSGELVYNRLPRYVELEACTVGPYGRNFRSELRRVMKDFRFQNRYTQDFSSIM